MSPRTTLGLPYILEARRNIRPYLSETPLRYSDYLSEVSGGTLDVELLREIVLGLDESSDEEPRSEH